MNIGVLRNVSQNKNNRATFLIDVDKRSGVNLEYFFELDLEMTVSRAANYPRLPSAVEIIPFRWSFEFMDRRGDLFH